MYKQSPSHSKTLNILAKSLKFSDYSVQQLEEFCNLARSEFGIDTLDEAIEFFESKYEWNIMSRKDELEKAWYSAANVVSNREDKVMERIPILLKKDSYSKQITLCQIHDPNLKLVGDTGAIGRFHMDEKDDVLFFDIKGRQYRGVIHPGPCVIVVNLAPNNNIANPGKTSSSVESKVEAVTGRVCAKAEAVVNDFCHLSFERDLLLDLQGARHGNIGSYSDDEQLVADRGVSGGESKSGGGSGRKGRANTPADLGGGRKRSRLKGAQHNEDGGGDDGDGDDGDSSSEVSGDASVGRVQSDSESDGAPKKARKQAAARGITGNKGMGKGTVKISTITHRRRVGGGRRRGARAGPRAVGSSRIGVADVRYC